MHYAIESKNINIIKILLDEGSDVNAYNGNGYNSLHLAIFIKLEEIVDLILKNKIHLNAKTPNGESALHLATNFELENIVKKLVKKGINVNLQDHENEITALNYVVSLNNSKIGKFLIENGADPNTQDFYGNTPLHYTIIEDNSMILQLLLFNPNTKNIINFNLHNVDGRLPLHICFLGDSSNIDTYIKLLIGGTDLNKQDNNGITCLHFLLKTGKWKDYKDILKKKKLNIFIKNDRETKPIDYIKKEDLEEFLEIVTKSYIHILRREKLVWKEDWENLCKEELFIYNLEDEKMNKIKKLISKNTDKSKDLCENIIMNKLKKLIKTCDKECESKSYPIERNSICLLVNEGKTLEFCTYTGTTLDVLVGLLYILRKHENTCSTLTTNFIKNPELCSQYKSLGISSGKQCDFLNFEIIWLYKKIHFPNEFISEFKNCKRSDSRFIIIPLGIELRKGSHANYLIYDKKKNEIERFEPHGSSKPYKFDYDPITLDLVLKQKFEELDENIRYVPPKEFLPKIGFQMFDIYESGCKKIGDPGGFCALWAVWYVDIRIKYPDIDRKKLVNSIISQIKLQNISFKNMIRNYSQDILELRNEILSKGNININDYINDNYTNEQISHIISALSELILDLKK
ncbi:MAG: hypothetical protein CMF62_02685 [Magnetococcales bacterium]|nr:hypothetical protein [Magnetococcales bacterium]